MIRSVLSLRAAENASDALERLYRDHDVLQRALAFPGCRSAVLLRATSASKVTHLVIADWDTTEDYLRWVDDPWRDAVAGELTELLDAGAGDAIVGGLFEFVATQ